MYNLGKNKGEKEEGKKKEEGRREKEEAHAGVSEKFGREFSVSLSLSLTTFSPSL